MTIASLKNQVKRQRSDAFAAARPGAKVSKPRAELVMPGRFDAAEMPRLDEYERKVFVRRVRRIHRNE